RKKSRNFNPRCFGPSPNLLPEAVRLTDALRSGAYDGNDPAFELHLGGADERCQHGGPIDRCLLLLRHAPAHAHERTLRACGYNLDGLYIRLCNEVEM